MRSNEKLHESLVLFTVEAYLSKELESGNSKEELHIQIVGAIRSYMVMRRFNNKEAKLLQELGETKTVQRIKDVEVSYSVYALELLRQWASSVKVNPLPVGRKKLLKGGKATFALDMIDLKSRNENKYKELKTIIDDSVINAKLFYGYSEDWISKNAK